MRLYALASRDGKTVLASAVSEDGLRFRPERALAGLEGLSSARVVRLDDGRWRLFSGVADGTIVSALSADGLAWAREPGVRISNAGFAARCCGPLAVVRMGDGYKGYFSATTVLPIGPADPGAWSIFSATSRDMLTWFMDAGERFGARSPVIHTAFVAGAVSEEDGRVTLYWYGGRYKSGSGSFVSDEGIYRARSVDGITFGPPEPLGLPAIEATAPVRARDGSLRIYYLLPRDRVLSASFRRP